MRFPSNFLLFAVLVSAASHSFAGTKKHHAAQNHAASVKSAQAQHLHRLAVKEKKAWRDHLAKLHSLPHAERIAEKRHEKLWKRKHDAKVDMMQAVHAAKLKSLQAAANKVRREQVRQAKINRRHHSKAVVAAAPKPAAKKSNGHARRLATLLAARQAAQHGAHLRQAAQHGAHLRQAALARRLAALDAVHQAAISHQHTAAAQKQAAKQTRSTQKQAAHQANLERRQALRALHFSKVMTAYRAHSSNLQVAHNARLAAQRSHWIALHGDGSGGGSIRFWQTAAADVPVKVISVDLNDANVKVSAVMARRGSGTSEPFRQMIARANPNVAVTGTFFSLDNLQPIGDIVIDGSLVHFGGMGTALCVTPSNHAEMVTCQWGRHHDWSPYDFVVACGPRLLQKGRIVLNPHAERFRDKHMLSPNSRIAVGITRGNTLFFAMTHTPIQLSRLARVMRSLGASEAMNLDAGTSTGFYYNGATLAKPGRKLTNMIVVYGRRDRYERALDQLVPEAYHRAATRDRGRVSQAVPASGVPNVSVMGRQ